MHKYEINRRNHNSGHTLSPALALTHLPTLNLHLNLSLPYAFHRIETTMIRILLPSHLRVLAQIPGEIQLQVPTPVTVRAILDTIEAKYPMLRGTIRDHVTHKRRPMVRFFACEEDLSHESPDTPLPDAVAQGKEPFFIIGAIAGG
jgi:molybdopterin synthase sulfur carrier subunit